MSVEAHGTAAGSDLSPHLRQVAAVSPEAGAFERWYRDAYPALVRALAAEGAPAAAREDAAAEAFTRAYERWARVAAMRSPFGWTYRVAVNLLRRRARRRKTEHRLLRRHQLDGHVQPRDPDPALWDAVRTLPARERQAVALRYLAGFKEREVANAMEISEGAASATLSSARRRLATIIERPAEDAR